MLNCPVKRIYLARVRSSKRTNMASQNIANGLISKCIPQIRRDQVRTLKHIGRFTVDWPFIKNTNTNKKYDLYTILTFACGIGGIILLHEYANYRGEERSAADSFHLRYPDPRISRLHQQVKIPEIMARRTRGPGAFCENEWKEFEDCFIKHTSLELNVGFKANLEAFATLASDCDEVKTSLHKCQQRALWDDELYYAAKYCSINKV